MELPPSLSPMGGHRRWSSRQPSAQPASSASPLGDSDKGLDPNEFETGSNGKPHLSPSEPMYMALCTVSCGTACAQNILLCLLTPW